MSNLPSAVPPQFPVPHQYSCPATLLISHISSPVPHQFTCPASVHLSPTSSPGCISSPVPHQFSCPASTLSSNRSPNLHRFSYPVSVSCLAPVSYPASLFLSRIHYLVPHPTSPPFCPVQHPFSCLASVTCPASVLMSRFRAPILNQFSCPASFPMSLNSSPVPHPTYTTCPVLHLFSCPASVASVSCPIS